MLAIAAMVFGAASCEKTPKPDGDEGSKGPELTEGFGVYIQADGSVIVEGDTGFDEDETDEYTGVNRLWSAITTYADELVTPTEGGDPVQCNNVFYLQEGEFYFVEGKIVIKKNVKIAALNPKGEMPWIRTIQDATGKTPADMLRFEANVVFDGVYFYGKDDKATPQQRMLRLDGSDISLTLDNCFADYTRNFFIRSDGKNNSVHLKNSTFRNMNYNNSSNGRLVDARGNDMDEITIENCLHYNCWGHIIRDNDAIINKIVIKNNTFYNVGTILSLTYPGDVTIQDNIFANVGWRQCARSLVPNETTGLVEPDCLFDFDDIDAAAHPELAEKVKIVIKNNNVYNTVELKKLYTDTEMAQEPELFSLGVKELQAKGKVTAEKNISEVLTFTKPCPINWDYIKLHFDNPNRPETDYAEMVWEQDEDGKSGIKVGQVYDFSYASSAQSAKASTTGGWLGARF